MPSLLFTSRPIVSPHRFDIFFYPCKFSGRRKDENLMVLSQDDSKCPNQMNPNGPWWIWPCAGGRCHPTKLTPFVNIPLCFFWIALFNFFRVSQYHATVIVYSWAKKSNQNYPFSVLKHGCMIFFGQIWGFELFGRSGTSVRYTVITILSQGYRKVFPSARRNLWQRAFRTWQDFLLTYCTKTNTTRQVLVMTRISGACWIQKTLHYHLV